MRICYMNLIVPFSKDTVPSHFNSLEIYLLMNPPDSSSVCFHQRMSSFWLSLPTFSQKLEVLDSYFNPD